MDKEISKILIVCSLIEGIITYTNSFFVSGNPHYQMFLSLLFGVSIAVAYKFDILKMINIESNIPYIGSVLTGIIFSRGSNYIHDVLSLMNLI